MRKAERRVGLVKGPGAQPYVWVQDAINANDKWGMFDWQLHTAPENKIRTQRRGAVVTGLRHGNQLGVEMFLPLFPGQRNSRDAHRIVEVFDDVAHPNAITYLGFDDPQKIKEKVAEYPRPAAMVEHGPVYERPRLVIRYEGWNGRSLVLMVPRVKGTAAPRMKQLEGVPGSIALEITFAEVTDVLIVSFDHPVLQAGGVDERGGWCVVRRNNKTGKVMQRIVGESVL